MISGFSRARMSQAAWKVLDERLQPEPPRSTFQGLPPWPTRPAPVVTALTAGMTLRGLAQLDLAYAPPYATLWDPVQVAAHVALRRFG